MLQVVSADNSYNMYEHLSKHMVGKLTVVVLRNACRVVMHSCITMSLKQVQFEVAESSVRLAAVQLPHVLIDEPTLMSMTQPAGNERDRYSGLGCCMQNRLWQIRDAYVGKSTLVESKTRSSSKTSMMKTICTQVTPPGA